MSATLTETLFDESPNESAGTASLPSFSDLAAEVAAMWPGIKPLPAGEVEWD